MEAGGHDSPGAPARKRSLPPPVPGVAGLQVLEEAGRQPDGHHAPDPEELFQELELQRPWEPILSGALQAKLNLGTLGQHGGRPPPDLASISDGSTISGLTTPMLDTLARMIAGGSTGGGTRSGDGRNKNEEFNEVLFGEYRRRSVWAKELQEKIEKGELPQLPDSKCGTCPMCTAWHIRAMCNPNCPRADDHQQYSTDEYKPLVDWCQANYPT